MKSFLKRGVHGKDQQTLQIPDSGEADEGWVSGKYKHHVELQAFPNVDNTRWCNKTMAMESRTTFSN